MKKLIALLLVVCMVAGLFVACKSKKPADTEGTEGTTATTATTETKPGDATDATGATTATDATDATDATAATDATDATDATGTTDATDATGVVDPTAAPVESTPVETTPVETTPVETTPVATTPVETTPVASTPSANVPTVVKPTAAVRPTAGNRPTSAATTAATTPAATTPAATTPAATTPAATTPAATAPGVNAPTIVKPTAVKPTAGQAPVVTTPAATTPAATTPAATTPQATTPQATTPQASVPVATTPSSQPYKGKTLQIYGMGTETTYTDYDQFQEYFTWMQKAAAVEWATMNGVTLEFKGQYDQSTMMSDINSGGRPDLIYQANQFPSVANVGLAGSFTSAEYNKIAEICGTEWLEMMKIGTKSYGFVVPWTGTMMCYYNKTMFEDYGVTTPKEHFLNGDWTWEQLAETMKEMTQDIDADGTIDTYGLNGDSWNNLVNPWATNSKGELISVIDEPWLKDFFQLKYDAYTVNNSTKAGKMNIQTNVIYPMFAMQFSDCEPYNFEHLYQYIPNGNELEVAPIPEWRDANGNSLGTSKVTQQAFSMAASCDEREATIDLLCYILKCGYKYMADYSLGALTSEYAGLQGTCELSVKYLNAFAKMNKRRAKDIAELTEDGIYDAEYIKAINEYLDQRGRYIWGPYTGVSNLVHYDEITKMTPENAIAQIRQKYQNSLDTYNKLYVNN